MPSFSVAVGNSITKENEEVAAPPPPLVEVEYLFPDPSRRLPLMVVVPTTNNVPDAVLVPTDSVEDALMVDALILAVLVVLPNALNANVADWLIAGAASERMKVFAVPFVADVPTVAVGLPPVVVEYPERMVEVGTVVKVRT